MAFSQALCTKLVWPGSNSLAVTVWKPGGSALVSTVAFRNEVIAPFIAVSFAMSRPELPAAAWVPASSALARPAASTVRTARFFLPCVLDTRDLLRKQCRMVPMGRLRPQEGGPRPGDAAVIPGRTDACLMCTPFFPWQCTYVPPRGR